LDLAMFNAGKNEVW